MPKGLPGWVVGVYNTLVVFGHASPTRDPRNLMRRLLLVFPLASVFLTLPDLVAAQDPDSVAATGDRPVVAPMQPWGGSISTPVLLALREWDTLQLSPEQVQQIRRLQEELSPAFRALVSEQMRSALPPSIWWSDESVDEASLRARYHRMAEQSATVTLRLLEARDRVYSVLNPEQRARLKALQRQEVEERTASLRADPVHRPCESGGSGGGFRLSDRAQVVYSVDFRGDSLRIGAVFIARAEDKLFGVPKLPEKPALPDSTGFLSGGTAGRWYLQYDQREHTAWVHTQKVPLGEDNVVLVDGIDGLHRPPRVGGTLRVPPSVYTGGCPRGERWSEVLRAHLEKAPEIRAFTGL